ncbi:ATP-binding protein [Cohnella sp. GCM10020058]|uniref:ATP-binding protein n=1 Tax=Cohnella sp. GCM10020058 TaxID=3317330 RepID=UPI00363A9126
MLPVSLLEGNVIYDTHGNPYAAYIVDSVPYAFQDATTKMGVIREVTNALKGLTDELYLYLLARQYSAEQIGEQMADFSTTPGWQRQIRLTQRELEEEQPFHRVNYVVVPLNKRMPLYFDQDKIQYIKEVLGNVWAGVQDVTGRLTRPLFGQEISYTLPFLEFVQEQADEMLDKLSGFKRIRKATMRECEWWLKKGYHRGLPDPELLLPEPFPVQVRTDDKEVRRIMPVRASLFTLSKLTKDHFDFLETHTDDGIAYHSYMPILSVPPEIDEQHPIGDEWIYGMVERLSFPVDIALKLVLETHSEASKKLKRRRKVVKAQIKEWQAGKQEVPEEVEEDLDGIDDVLRKFREQKIPLIHMTGVCAVGASSQGELRSRKKSLIDAAEKMDVILANSPGDQQRMFQHFYPFAKKNLTDRWKIPMEPGIIGSAVPFGVRKLGDPSGFFLGELLGVKRPVFCNPYRPAMDKSLNRANTVLIVGVPGSGKTATAKDFIYNVTEWGAFGFAEDPKGDFQRFFEHPLISKVGRLVSFTPGSNTRFTPFRLSEDESARRSAAATNLELLLNPAGAGVNEVRGFVIDLAMNRTYESDKWDMHQFARELQRIEENHPKVDYRHQAEMCLGHLNKLKTRGISSMLFGEDTGESLFDRQLLIAITRGLKIPDRRKAVTEWTDDERASAAIKYSTSTMALDRLMALPEHLPKVLDLEEYWILKAFPGGQQLVETAIRFSRYTNLLVILSTQNATDADDDQEDGDDVTGMFSWKIVLRLDSQDQIAAALKLLGMSGERAKDWLTTFSKEYKNGKGIVKDPEGNIGEMQIKPLDPDLMKYLESTPGEDEEVMGA